MLITGLNGKLGIFWCNTGSEFFFLRSFILSPTAP